MGQSNEEGKFLDKIVANDCSRQIQLAVQAVFLGTSSENSYIISLNLVEP